jgi:hypothetical protein
LLLLLLLLPPLSEKGLANQAPAQVGGKQGQCRRIWF